MGSFPAIVFQLGNKAVFASNAPPKIIFTLFLQMWSKVLYLYKL